MVKKLTSLILAGVLSFLGIQLARAVSTYKTAGTAIGFLPTAVPTAATALLLNTTSTWRAYGFVMDHQTTLANVRVFMNAVSGTVPSASAVCALYNDASGVPGTQLEAQNLGSNVVVSTWNVWSGFTTSLSTGTQYWIVLKNLDASPGTNNYTLRWVAGSAVPVYLTGGNATYGWGGVGTANSGVLWATTAQAGMGGIWINFGDGSGNGTPISNCAPGAAGEQVFQSTEVGVAFTMPSNGSVNLSGLAFYIRETGNPTGPINFRIYSGASTTPLATTFPITTSGPTTTNSYIPAYFQTPVQLSGGTTYRVTIAEPGNTDSSAVFLGTIFYTWDGNFTAALPFEGTARETVLKGGAWTDTTAKICPFGLILDSNGEFYSSGAAGGTQMSVYVQ